ncbi:MAG: bifunctional precorrin-2 dehydrogenase/sirohydrochlorin ferrochelatase [Coriobacteriaceae bacterium]|nr:bifunctional precorrin-2 dehydrogenase/sirohydrochlorin ferrochelatase [Coriobacteriaceae bacterium]
MENRQDAAGRCEPYPLFANLRGEPVVVVGGGEVAERKVETLLDHGASIVLVAPAVTETLRAWALEKRIGWLPRRYEAGDLEGALLVVCATDDEAVNKAVHAEAVRRHQLVNVVDVPELCNFIVPSVLRRGHLQIAVSTGGASPSAAREIRKSLERQFPTYWEDYLDMMAELRCLVKARVAGPMERRAPLYQAICDSDLLARFEAGERPDAEEAYRQVVEPALKEDAR